MLVKIKDIVPNPFRNIEHYPINRAKVEALKASFDRTEFWDNVLGRERKVKVASVERIKVELAYGHHRWIALKEFYGPDHEVNITTRDLTDADMIVIMAGENMDDWSTSAIVEIETIEAVVKAYGEGKITDKMPKVDKKAHQSSIRYAPSFIPDETVADGLMPYTAQSVGEFLGWIQQKSGIAQDKVSVALTALQFIQEGIVELSAFEGMGTKGIQAVITEARRARAIKESQAQLAAQRAEFNRKEAEEAKRREEKARAEAEKYRRQRKEAEEREARERAREAEKERQEYIKAKAREEAEAAARRKEGREVARKVTAAVSKHIKSGGGTKTAADAAIKAVPRHNKPQIAHFLEKLRREVGNFLCGDALSQKLQEVLEDKEAIDEDDLEKTRDSLLRAAKRASDYAEEFKPVSTAEKRAKGVHLALNNSK